MKPRFIHAALAAVFFVATLTCATAATTKPPANQLSPSKPVKKLLDATQKLIAANDFKTAMDTLHSAQALPDRTADDDYLIDEFLAAVSIKLNDMPSATTAFEGMADSPLLDKDPNKAQILGNAMIVENVSKNYAKTVAYGTKLAAVQPLTSSQLSSLTEAYYLNKDYAHVKEVAQKAIDSSKTTGTLPPQNVLSMLMNSDLNTGDQAGALAVSEEIAADYNVASDWARLIDIALSAKQQPIDALDLLRLGIATGASLDQSDYHFMGDIAMRAGFYGDAATAERHGGKVAGAGAKAAGDEKELPAQIAAAKDQDAKHNLVLSEDVYGYGRYAEAEELARRAQSKGGPADETNMLIGMSLVGEGKYADAVSVFQKVNGRGAHLWTLYAQHKEAPPAPSPAAPPAAH